MFFSQGWRAAALAAALTAQPLLAEEPVRGGTLVWGHSEPTQNLDIHLAGAASSARMLQNVHAGLVTVDADFNVVPDLAESYDISEDGLTYSFTLRDGLTFHDGSALTAADVKYSFDRIRDPETGAVNKDVFNAVETIETPDDRTVVVRMATVNAPFLARLAENGAGAIIPEGSADAQGEHPVGAGPFAFVEREFGEKVVLARFDDYWAGPAYLDGVIAREIAEPTTRMTGLLTGELDLINDLPNDRVAELQDKPELQVLTWLPLNFDLINLNQDFEPFKDARVRQALDMLVDKQMLLEGALWGQGQATASPSFPSSPSYNAGLTQRAQDIAGAQALLAEAGQSDLELVFKVTTNFPYHAQAAQIMQEWFAAAGIKTTIEQLTWPDWLSQIWVDRDYQITMMNFATLWEPDFLYASLWGKEGGFNYRAIDNPEVDALIEQARQTMDPEARAAIYKQIQQIIHDETLDVVLWFRTGSVAARREVMGLDTVVHPNGSNLNFHRVWLKP